MAALGVFYSYVKLKEQEIRNLVWISECILQDKKDKVRTCLYSIAVYPYTNDIFNILDR